MAFNLKSQGKYAAAQPLFEKALDITRRLLTDDHPLTAKSYLNLASNLKAGKYATAQPLLSQPRFATDCSHRRSPGSRNQLFPGGQSQRPGQVQGGAPDWLMAVRSPGCRTTTNAFTGMERAGDRPIPATRTRLRDGPARTAGRRMANPRGRPRPRITRRARRTQRPAARTGPERARLRELTSELERLRPAGGNARPRVSTKLGGQAGRGTEAPARPASIAAGEFQTKLVQDAAMWRAIFIAPRRSRPPRPPMPLPPWSPGSISNPRDQTRTPMVSTGRGRPHTRRPDLGRHRRDWSERTVDRRG